MSQFTPLILCSIFVATLLEAGETGIKHTASQGEEVLLPCHGCDLPNMGVDWWVTYTAQNGRRPEMISPVGKIITGFVDRFELTRSEVGYCNLVILHTRVSDTGTYTCIVDGGYGRSTVTRLEVSNAPSTLLLAFVGDPLVIPCKVKTLSEHESRNVDWWFQPAIGDVSKQAVSSGQVINGFRKRFVLDATVDWQTNLVVRSSWLNDSGLYTCIADAGFGQRQAVKVDVIIPSDSTADKSISVTLTGGEKAKLPCTVHPTANTRSWRYQSTHSSTSKELSSEGHMFGVYAGRMSLEINASGVYNIIIRAVQPNDSGIYDCVEVLDNGLRRRSRIIVDVKEAFNQHETVHVSMDEPKHQHVKVIESNSSVYAITVSIVLVTSIIVLVVIVVFFNPYKEGAKAGSQNCKFEKIQSDVAAADIDSGELCCK